MIVSPFGAGVVVDDARLAYEIAVKHGGRGVLEPLLLEEKANGESLTISEVRQREPCCSGRRFPLPFCRLVWRFQHIWVLSSNQQVARVPFQNNIHAGP